MEPIKKFEEWLNEDFATVANTSGMGDVTPPTSTTVGSGDAWPSLGAPSTQTGSKKKKRRKKRKSKKVQESTSELNNEEVIDIFSDATLSGAARDTNIDDRDWIGFFDHFYGCEARSLKTDLQKELRKLFTEFRYEFWVEFNHDSKDDDITAILNDGWKLLGEYKDEGATVNASFITRFFYKELTEKDVKDNYDEVFSDFRKKLPSLDKKTVEFIMNILTPEDKKAVRGQKGMSRFGL